MIEGSGDVERSKRLKINEYKLHLYCFNKILYYLFVFFILQLNNFNVFSVFLSIYYKLLRHYASFIFNLLEIDTINNLDANAYTMVITMSSFFKTYSSVLNAILIIFLVFSCFLGLLLGSVQLPIAEIFKSLIYPFVNSFASWPVETQLLWELRLPRIILSATLGMGLTLSGIIMQAIFRNPLSSPYILGISSGASLGAVCAICLGAGTFLGSEIIGIGAFIGSILLSFIVVCAVRRSHGDMTYLLIIGIALAAVCTGFTSVLVFMGADSTGTDITIYWLTGNVAGAKLVDSLFLLLIVLFSIFYFMTQGRILNLMIEGNHTALTLGVYLPTFIKKYLLINAILVASIVMNAGIIGFIGLIIPHFMRALIGADHRKLIPSAVLAGGIFAVWSDIIGRTLISNIDIPLGVTMAVIGTPCFAFLLCKKAYYF